MTIRSILVGSGLQVISLFEAEIEKACAFFFPGNRTPLIGQLNGSGVHSQKPASYAMAQALPASQRTGYQERDNPVPSTSLG